MSRADIEFWSDQLWQAHELGDVDGSDIESMVEVAKFKIDAMQEYASVLRRVRHPLRRRPVLHGHGQGLARHPGLASPAAG